jgi:hypothetical protein
VSVLRGRRRHLIVLLAGTFGNRPAAQASGLGMWQLPITVKPAASFSSACSAVFICPAASCLLYIFSADKQHLRFPLGGKGRTSPDNPAYYITNSM